MKNMAKKSAAGKLTYAEAVAGIEDILTRLRSEQISVDELAQQVARATELIAFCKGVCTMPRRRFRECCRRRRVRIRTGKRIDVRRQ